MTVSAALSGTFAIADDIPVHRLGYGAMRITGPGVWGPPRDRAGALNVLRRLPDDTADSYGPDVSEKLIREALHPYSGLLVATKAGFIRSGPDMWHVDCRPEHLLAAARKSRETLGVERIALWQLHRIDRRVPQDEQFAAIRQLVDEGVIAHAGLSEVSVAQIEAARKVFPVATVQNRYNLADRASDVVVNYCTAHGIGFIPYFPLGGGHLAVPGGTLERLAQARGCTTGQLALAWLLQRAPVMLPIPGTSSLSHLEENVAAAAMTLSAAEIGALNRLV